jgi:hypothetical protein
MPGTAAAQLRVRRPILLLWAEGYLRMTAELMRRGYEPLVLDMSAFRKVDGNLMHFPKYCELSDSGEC